MPTAALFTVQEVADALRVSERTVRTLIAEGRLTAFRVRGQRGPLRIREDDLERLMTPSNDEGPAGTEPRLIHGPVGAGRRGAT